jgi:hypothetical protein
MFEILAEAEHGGITARRFVTLRANAGRSL